MNAPEKFFLPDTQALPDVRQMPIQKVGVKGLRYPIDLRGAAGDVQQTIAEFAMYVGLPHDVKGTHKSRFVENIVRDIALRMQRDPRVGRFTVGSENFESIHNHSAYAEIEGVGAALID
jgi:GTP cyclohydrolase FolE2